MLKAAVQRSPREAGFAVGNWTWKVVRQFVRETFGKCLARSRCFRYLHRLGFVWKRPKQRLLKADADRRAAFVWEYMALVAAAAQTGATIFFADEAHFRADGEKARYYSAVCVETGAVEVMELDGTSTAETSVAFLRHLRPASRTADRDLG